MELTNRFLTLIVYYKNKEDLNNMYDDLNDKLIQKGISDRDIIILYIKKDIKFYVELIDINGKVKLETNKYNDNFFDKLFDTIDNYPTKDIEASEDSNKSENIILTTKTDTVSTNIPSDDYITSIKNKVKVIERLESNQEVEDNPIGVTYIDGTNSPTNVSKNDYWTMKSKYLKLKNKLTKK